MRDYYYIIFIEATLFLPNKYFKRLQTLFYIYIILQIKYCQISKDYKITSEIYITR
jgi:hypothetical protein